jgi:IS605 OrfB family transposase
LKEFFIPMPSNLDFSVIRQVRIVPRNGVFYAEYVYAVAKKTFFDGIWHSETSVYGPAIPNQLDPTRVLGIDHGMNNWLTCVSNVGTSFIIDGLKLKSLNQGYNKRVAKLMSDKPNGFWSKRLESLTEKRNRQMRDAVNKAARIVVSHCLENKIGTLVFGWNKGQKNGATMGKKTNQKFVQIPTARLKERIKQLCEIHGIQFEETEESYTSKASFLDADTLPVYGEKPEGWKSSGKRVKRGLFRSGMNFYINADCNGAGNIIRKVAIKLGLCLDGVSRGSLTSPLKIRLWSPISSQKSQSL